MRKIDVLRSRKAHRIKTDRARRKQIWIAKLSVLRRKLREALRERGIWGPQVIAQVGHFGLRYDDDRRRVIARLLIRGTRSNDYLHRKAIPFIRQLLAD